MIIALPAVVMVISFAAMDVPGLFTSDVSILQWSKANFQIVGIATLATCHEILE